MLAPIVASAGTASESGITAEVSAGSNLTVAVCAMFTTVTGASGVTIVAVGGLVMPSLIKDGYKERFGLIYVDYASGERVPKDSYHWYRRIIASNGRAALGEDAERAHTLDFEADHRAALEAMRAAAAQP